MLVRRAALAATVTAVFFFAAGGCGSDRKDLFVRAFDAGEGGDAAASPDATPDVDPTLGGPCNEDAQCDDGIACTFDKCDPTLSRCRNTPDDTQCDDGLFCDGKEKCVLRLGCAAGPVVTCQDDDLCTIDTCVEASKACKHATRDVDGDGDPDDHCVGHADCDDTDPTVNSKVAEICGNFKDDNCNGEVDEQPCSAPANDTCANALAVKASGTYFVTTVAAQKDYATSCTVTQAGAAKDVVVAITPPGAAGDPPVDVEIWATAEDTNGGNEVALAIESTCGVSASETSCAHFPATANARGIVRGVVPGTTRWAIVTTQAESIVDVRVDIRPAQPKPANESCAAPVDVALETPFTVRLIDPAPDLGSACKTIGTGDLTYRFTLTQAEDVRVFASTLAGTGQPIVSLRASDCTDELHCRASNPPPLYARALPPGPYVLAVSGSSQIDASVLVKTYPPTTPPPNQSCATAPAATTNAAFAVDLSNNEEIKNGCFPGGPSAAYDVELTEASDVLLVARFPQTEGGGVSLNAPACTSADVLVCGVGGSPVRASKRNVPAGSYRAVIADQQGQLDQLNVLVRPTVPPTSITASDSCLDAATIPPAGGFFTGDTTGAQADFGASCDATGGTIGGARDQILRLDLPAKQRVVFDMSGSTYTTLLAIRQGATCPGVEVVNACNPGFSPDKSFVDVTLDAGTYWVQIDGYNAEAGQWNLDVRMLPP